MKAQNVKRAEKQRNVRSLIPFPSYERREKGVYNRSPVELLLKHRGIQAERIAGTASAIGDATYRSLIG